MSAYNLAPAATSSLVACCDEGEDDVGCVLSCESFVVVALDDVLLCIDGEMLNTLRPDVQWHQNGTRASQNYGHVITALFIIPI